MASEWTTIRAADFIEFNPRLSIKKNAIATKVAMDKLQPFTKKIPATEQAEFAGGSKFCNGDTIMARITPCLENGKTAFVDILQDGEVGFGSTEFIVMRAREGISDPQFVYYLATSPLFRNVAIKSMVGSSGRQRVQQGVLDDLELVVPPREEQQKIGAFLALFDEKIALNNKINDNLLDLATALFNQTITENNATLVIKIVSEIADVKGGKRLPKGINLQTTPNNHPYIRVRDLNDACIVQLTPNFEYVDDETQKGISRYIVHTSDIIVSIVGTIGLTALIHESLDNANLTENCVKITNLKEVSPEYLLLFLRSVDGQNAICQGTVGAVQAKLPIKNIQSIPVPIIPEPQRNQLNDQLHTIFLSIAANLSENSHLIQIRDSLLPRLMSGDIDVSEVSI